MSGRGNGHENAVAGNFFQLLKYERKKKIYGTWEEAHSDNYDYIENFYYTKYWYGSRDQMLLTE
ncbi:hypothetical protein WP8W18C04_15800 [Enterobacter cloacae]|nr:hypothetical protein WP8W18C04_15800 [Enterobacter cloacae]